MKKLGMLGIIGGAAILTAVPLSLQWSQKNVTLSLASAEAQERPLTATSVAGVSRRVTVQLFRRTVQLLTAFRDLLLRVPAALVLVICAAPVVLRAENHNPVFLPHSSSASRLTAGASEFFIFSQSGERPER